MPTIATRDNGGGVTIRLALTVAMKVSRGSTVSSDAVTMLFPEFIMRGEGRFAALNPHQH